MNRITLSLLAVFMVTAGLSERALSQDSMALANAVVAAADRSPEDRALDAVTMVLFYHDTVWLGVDREAMNKAVFAALKPGGVFLIVDHSARPGDGVEVSNTFHRIEEDAVKTEVQAAGFVLDGQADFLRNKDDTRDWNDSPRAAGERRGTSDRFVLRFRKP